MKKSQHFISRRTGIAGLSLYAISCISLLVGFSLPAAVGIPLTLLAFIPVFYGAHEALHGSLVAWRGVNPRAAVTINEIACALGFALQGMNFRLLRPAHIWHHASGRYEEGYAPDIAGEKVTLRDYLHYYLTLFGLPALQWQAAGFLALLIPLRKLPFTGNIQFASDRGFIPRNCAQLLVIAFWIYAIGMGGPIRAITFLFSMSLIWSLLQNVSHYGLKGIDPVSDRVCAHTYILPPAFRYITYGSLSHFAHHVDMTTPGLLLHHTDVLESVEHRIGIAIKPKYGIMTFIADIFRQIRGPLPGSALSSSWIDDDKMGRPQREADMVASFQKRKGRHWRRI